MRKKVPRALRARHLFAPFQLSEAGLKWGYRTGVKAIRRFLAKKIPNFGWQLRYPKLGIFLLGENLSLRPSGKL
jgi:hypothetical protein